MCWLLRTGETNYGYAWSSVVVAQCKTFTMVCLQTYFMYLSFSSVQLVLFLA